MFQYLSKYYVANLNGAVLIFYKSSIIQKQRIQLSLRMSKTNLLLGKKTPSNFIFIAKTQPQPIDKHVTYRDSNKQENDNTKLYTFCSSQNKPPNLSFCNQEKISNQERQRKVSMSNIRGKIYEPQSRSKGKIATPLMIKDRKKPATSFALNGNSLLNDRRKTEKLTIARGQQKKINISINMYRNQECQTENPKEDGQLINILKDKTGIFHNLSSPSTRTNCSTVSILEAISSREKKQDTKKKDKDNSYCLQSKKIIALTEEDLATFTKKHANQKFIFERNEELLKEYQQKQVEWRHFKKDSEDYIGYIETEKQQLLNQCKQLQESLKTLSTDKEYYAIAKEQYFNTIKQQQQEIHLLHSQIDQLKNQISQQCRKCNSNKQQIEEIKKNYMHMVQLLEIENNHLKKELEINDHQIKAMIRPEKQLDRHFEELHQRLSELSESNNLLSQQLKQLYICKLKSEVFQKTIEECTQVISKLQQQNLSLKEKLAEGMESLKDFSLLSEFQFRLDSSPHSPSEVEVIWKRQAHKEGVPIGKKVQDYFDHQFFSDKC